MRHNDKKLIAFNGEQIQSDLLISQMTATDEAVKGQATFRRLLFEQSNNVASLPEQNPL